jgi:hypothetical protein
MKKLFPIIAVMILVVTPIIVAEADADDSTQTVRWSRYDLYHATATAIESASLKDNNSLWVFQKGQDSAMKAYINNPQTAAVPVGLNEVTYDQEYDIYYLETAYVSYLFSYESEDKVLSDFDYPLVVKERTSVKLKVLTISANGSPVNYYDLHYMPSGSSTYHRLGEVVNLNYVDDTGYYAMKCYYNDSLFVEAQIQLSVKEINGSPTLYITLCVAITALVALTIAYCGRKPKL